MNKETTTEQKQNKLNRKNIFSKILRGIQALNKVDTARIKSNVSKKIKHGHSLLKEKYQKKAPSFYEWKDKKLKQFAQCKTQVKGFLFASTPEEAHYRIEIAKTIRAQLDAPIRTGLIIIAIGFSFFGIWGILAPLDTASYAPGYIVPSGHPKLIQHNEGGVIKEILVKDGDYVLKDQPLIILDTRHAQTENSIILARLRTWIAIEKRLSAEMTGAKKIDFNDPLLDTKDEAVRIILRNQQLIFDAKNKEYSENVKAYQKIEDSFKENIKIHQAALESMRAELRLVEKLKKSSEALFNKKLATQGEMVHIQRLSQELLGRINETVARILATQDEMHSRTAQRIALEQQQQHRTQDEYKQNHVSLLEDRARYEHAKEVLSRTVIRAPSEGTILNLAYHSQGGVIHPNVKIMEIIPKEEELVAEVKVSIRDIDNIHVGSKVKVSLEAYKARFVPRIDGKVIYISADRILPDRMMPNSQPEYYLARIQINKSMISHLTTKVELYPGMPVNAFIIVGTKTFMAILLSPIIDSFHKAFKEM